MKRWFYVSAIRGTSSLRWGVSPVLGEEVAIKKGFRFFIHRLDNDANNKWRITEFISGGSIADGRTKAQTIKRAKNECAKISKKKLRGKIAVYIKGRNNGKPVNYTQQGE